MILTQKHSMTVISVNDELARDFIQEEVIRRNADVLREIEYVLEDYPEHPYQVAFAIDELRSKLIAHVLRHIPNRQPVIGDAKEPTTNTKSPYRSKGERMRLNVLIRGSILHLLRENADWIGRQIQRLDNSGNNTLETLR